MEPSPTAAAEFIGGGTSAGVARSGRASASGGAEKGRADDCNRGSQEPSSSGLTPPSSSSSGVARRPAALSVNGVGVGLGVDEIGNAAQGNRSGEGFKNGIMGSSAAASTDSQTPTSSSSTAPHTSRLHALYPAGRILHLLPHSRISGPGKPLPSSSCPTPSWTPSHSQPIHNPFHPSSSSNERASDRPGAFPGPNATTSGLGAAAEAIRSHSPVPPGMRPTAHDLASARTAYFQTPYVLLEVPDNQVYDYIPRVDILVGMGRTRAAMDVTQNGQFITDGILGVRG